jgi:hypothetical protein
MLPVYVLPELGQAPSVTLRRRRGGGNRGKNAML